MNCILHDRTMQTLVDKLFPIPESEPAQMPRRVPRANGSSPTQRPQRAPAPLPAIPSPAMPASIAKVGRQTSAGRQSTPASAPQRENTNTPLSLIQDGQQVSFKVEPARPNSSDESLPILDKPYLKTSGKLKVSQLCRYLAKKLGVTTSSLELLCGGEPLPFEHSLHFIKRTLWFDENTELIITYRQNSEAMDSRI